MFVAGTSTHKVGDVAETLLGVAPSASDVRRLNRDLEQQFTAWRERRLQEHWRILYLDGIHFSVRHGDQADSTVILTALGVDLAGNKEVVALRACAEESKEGWVSVLEDLRRRGATQVDLMVTAGHDGRLSAVNALFSATARQRCLVHKQRNVLPRGQEAGASGSRSRTAGHLGPVYQARGFDAVGREHSPHMVTCIQRPCGAWPKRKTRLSPLMTFRRPCTAPSGRPTPSRVCGASSVSGLTRSIRSRPR